MKRANWHASQEDVDPERLVLLDETGLKTKLTRLRGWAAGGERLVEAVGARFVYRPPYSPDLNPIENIFSKVKQLLRRLRPRSFSEIVKASGQVLARITLDDLEAVFAHCGYAVAY